MTSTSTCNGCGRAFTEQPNSLCPNLNHWRARVEQLGRLTPRQRDGLRKLLRKVVSDSDANWEQHLRYDVGDEDTDAIMAWFKAHGIIEPTRSSP